MDGGVLLEDPLDPMIPGLGSFELIDDEDPRTLGWEGPSPFRRTIRALKVPALIIGGLLVGAGLTLSISRSASGDSASGGEAEAGGAVAIPAPHTSLLHAESQNSTHIGSGAVSSTPVGASAASAPGTLTTSTGVSTTQTGVLGALERTTSGASGVSLANSTRRDASLSTSRATTATTSRPAPMTTSTTSTTTCAPSIWSRYRDCKSHSGEISSLRCQLWPLEHKGPAPQISRALYINLDRDLRRRTWMEGQLQAIRENLTAEARMQGRSRNFTTERVSAVDIGQARNDPEYRHIRERGFNPTPYPSVQGKWSVAGCSLSHLKILRRLSEHADELLARREVWLILEDDAIVTPEIDADWQRIWPWLPEDWDLVRLGWFGGSTCVGRVNDRVDLALWSDPPPSGPCSYCGSHAYIVSPASIGKVIHRIEASKLMHVDCLLSAPTPPMENPRELPEIRAYAVRPILVLQNEDFPSDRIA